MKQRKALKIFALAFIVALATTSNLNAAQQRKEEPAYDYRKGVCSLGDDAEFKKEYSAFISKANQLLPSIPPDEAAYLKEESSALTNTTIPHDAWTQRVNALHARPFYHAWKVRQELRRFNLAFTAVVDYQTVVNMVRNTPLSDVSDEAGYAANLLGQTYMNPEAEKLRRAISLLSDLSTLQDAINEYVDSEWKTHGLTEVSVYLYSESRHLFSVLASFMDCKLANIAQKSGAASPPHGPLMGH